MFVPDNVKVPAPFLVNVAPEPVIAAVIAPAPLFVITNAALLPKPIDVALNPSVVTVNPVNAAAPPTSSLNVTSPVPLVAIVKA